MVSEEVFSTSDSNQLIEFKPVMAYMVEMINDQIFKIEEDQTILEASLAAGIKHYHVCGGNAKCSTCRVIVHEGENHLTEQNRAERRLRKRKNFPDNVRLACQTKVTGGKVKLQRIIKDSTDLNLYVYGNSVDARQGIGEEKELALMFVDIRNFTPFIEQHLPFDVIHLIRRLNFLFNKVVEEGKGKIIEFLGDGFYAVFGLDEEIEAAIHNAVETGHKIHNELKQLNKSYISKYFEIEIEVGIGVHFGKVILGEKGIGETQILTAMGFPVNVAARLETATKELNNNFIISEEVYKLLNGEANPAVQKQIKLKGISEPLCVRLIGEEYSFDYAKIE